MGQKAGAKKATPSILNNIINIYQRAMISSNDVTSMRVSGETLTRDEGN